MTGVCVNCHTMHNSQHSQPMATYGAAGQPWTGTGPFPALVRGDCLGCHGMGTANRIALVNGSEIPQVLHNDPAGDLAGGNFSYILGLKGSGPSDAKGHNVIELGRNDSRLSYPPGGVSFFPGHQMIVNNTNFSCAGRTGCHGGRNYNDPPSAIGLSSLRGAHHRSAGGKMDIADDVYNSYRFLEGVKGLENPNAASRWQNLDAQNHNEYFGVVSPPAYTMNCTTSCHAGRGGDTVSISGSMSGFCGTCHGNFHQRRDVASGFPPGTGIGSGASPFIRHPTDIVLPASGEYAGYTAYSVQAPVARTTVPDAPSGIVTPGLDTVMCLSCHTAHASDYPSMLRWDYTTMVAGGGAGGGCFTCHRTKNGSP